MPHNWVEMSNTPQPWKSVTHDPTRFRDAVEKTVEHFEGRLQYMYWAVHEPSSYGLIEGPDDPVKFKAMLRALPTKRAIPVLDHADAQRAFDHAKTAPPPDGDAGSG